MRRRALVAIAPAAIAAPSLACAASSTGGPDPDRTAGDPDGAIERFLALPGTKSYLVHAGPGGSLGRLAHEPRRLLFVGSAFKTFVLGQYLRDVEAGRLSEDEQLAIDDGVRTPGSPVFLGLAGTTAARSVLEAMIAHSDNMATDAAMLKVGADRVRALVARAGLRATRIPTSTRRFFSYLVGAPEGVDLGWAGVQRALEQPPGPLRPPLNEVETLASTAAEMVSWYEQALAGRFFARPETLIEFKRIQAMADAIARVVPPDTAAYAKGGSIEFGGFNCISLPGQMVVRAEHPVTFCFTLNWESSEGGFAEVAGRFAQAVAGILAGVKRDLR
jgi:beta-lactamase class A